MLVFDLVGVCVVLVFVKLFLLGFVYACLCCLCSSSFVLVFVF